MRQPAEPIPSLPRVAIYCRVSSSAQEDNSSLQTQEERCRQYARERGWIVTGVFREVHTGAELFERAELTRLRGAMRQREFDILLVHALDRLSRKQTHQGLILSEAEHAGVQWVSVTEDVDDSPQGQILRAVIGGMAELERLKLTERTVRGRRARAEAGKLLPGAAALYGYRWRDHTKAAYDIDPVRGPIVQHIFRDVITGRTIRSIALRLTDDGIPTPSGNLRWSPSTIHSMLKRQSYTGEAAVWRHARERKPSGGTRRFVRPEAEQTKLPSGTVPPLIALEEFEAVQQRLQFNREQAARNNRTPEATLLRGGYARCGYCGTTLTVVTRRNLVYYRHGSRSRDRYECPTTSIKTDRLDAAVWQRVEGIVLHPKIVAAEAARHRGSDPTAADTALIDHRLQDIGRRQANLIRRMSLLEDEETVMLVTAEVNALASQKRQLHDERTAIEHRQATWQATGEQLLQLEDWCRRVATNLPTLDYTQKRSLLEALGVRVALYHSDHDPRYEIRAAIPMSDDIASITT